MNLKEFRINIYHSQTSGIKNKEEILKAAREKHLPIGGKERE